jgi:hypothetical protein
MRGCRRLWNLLGPKVGPKADRFDSIENVPEA